MENTLVETRTNTNWTHNYGDYPRPVLPEIYDDASSNTLCATSYRQDLLYNLLSGSHS